MNYNDITMERHCVHSLQKTGIANVKRFFCLFLFLIAFVGNALAEAVTETYTVASTKSFTAGTAFNPTENISLTYGISDDDSRWNVAQHNGSYYAYSNRNPNKNPSVSQGTFLVVKSTKDGAISFDIYMNSDAERYVYVYEENTGSALASVSNGSNGKSNIQLNFNVTADKNYYIVGAANQNNARYGGYTFTPGGSTGDSGSDSGDDSGDDDDDSGSSSSTWTSTVTGAALDYTVHTPSTQAYDQNGKPMTVVYLTNLGFTNISTVSNDENIQWLCNQGYQVIALDYSSNANAVSPKINADIISINNNLKSGTFLEQTCSPLRSYILMEGYRIERDIPYYQDDPTVYNYSDNYTTGDNLYLDLVYPASPSEEVPVLITFAYSNSYDGSEHQRMNLGNTWGSYSDSFVEGASAVGFAWAICDHPKYCDWGQGKYTGGANKSLASVEVNPDAARKVKAAIRTVRGKGESLGLNGAVAVTGFSRGSTAASLAVGDGDIDTFEDMTRINNSDYSEQSSKVQCAVLGPGMFDYQSANQSSNDYTIISKYVSATSASFEQQGALATILTNASAPTLFYHNTDDYYHQDSNGLYVDQATTMKNKLDDLGVTTEKITGYSSGHAVPQDETNLTKMYEFLTEYTVLTTSDDDDDSSSSTETPEGTMNTLKIDFSAGTGNDAYISDGYTDWYLENEIESGKSESKTIDGVTIKISHGSNTQADIIKRNWYKDGLGTGTEETKLVCDGIYARLEEDNANYGDGNYGATSERVAIDVTISGLEVGKYSLLAYHNYVMSDSHTLPTIGVEVDGTVIESGIQQTQRKLTKVDAAYSLVNFEVTETGKDVVVTYFSDPVDGESYTRTYFFINSLELSSSVVSPDDKISNSYPTNLDYHVEAENGLILTWDAPNNGADSYTVYFDTDEETVTNGTAASEPLQTTSFTKTGLSPLNRYYWRVDVVRDGETYQGDVWGFQPRRLAFPGADGAGKYAVGGRGYNGNGDVYHVTNLNDSGAGSLRYGIENATGPRTIVFDVAGVITLTSDLKCNKPNITVAGQTAPGIGILLRDDSYSADSEDGITRFMRFRFGHGDDWNPESGVGNSNVGNAAGIQTDYHIMDHCLLAWGSDETFASRGAKNITFQHSLIGESLNQNGHDKYYDEDPNVQHGYAATIGGETGSYHHNLLAHNEGRNWSMSGGLLGNEFAGKMNMYNNVVYNWHGRTNDGGTHNGNFVNNYYKMMTTAENSNTEEYIFIATHEDDYQGSQEYYVAGNIRRNKDGSETSDAEGVTYKNEFKNGMSIDYDDFKDVPYDCWNVESKSVSEIESAQSAFKNVLSDVGCNYKQLDNNEKRLIEETLKGTYSKTGSRSGLKGHIDKESDSEGWDGLGMIEAERPTGWDSDGDGIPAWFETAMGWNDSAGNNNDDSNGDYYTDLEEYLNWVAVPHFYNMANDGTVTALETGTNHTITLADYFAGYTSPTYTVVSDGGATTSISDGVLTYNFPANASKLATIQVKATQDGISLTRSFNFFIDASDVEVTPEGTAYTLTSSTYTSSTNTTTWNFNNGFAITNANEKAYASANYETIKYSNGIQFTITIPDGMSANGIKFYGYANDDSSDGYIAELNGETYGEDQYVFPSRANSTTEEYTIAFAQPATGTITFTVNKQCALAITLYATGTPAVTPDDDTELAPAFPGAEGSGRYAQGGRGTNGTTNVYHVTSLKDDKNVEGTLRWALAQDGPRTIVFDVSGYIDLASDLKIPSNTTIAGQTAPAPGITLRYYTVNTSDAENVIIRYMRFRRSQVKDVNDGADAVWGRHGNNIILDHCSFSWSIDEVASFYDNRDFTMQWCVVAEGLCNSGHTKGGHSYGGIWGGKNATFHHNMITNVQNRAPRLCGARFNWDGYDTETYANSVQAERVDVRNNLYYNWGNGNGAYGGMGGYHNLVNNYYKAGPGTKNTSRVFQGSANSSDDSNGVLPDGLPGRFYIDGNYVTAQSAIYDWSGFKQDSGTGVNTSALTYTDSQGLYGAAGETVSIKLDGEVDMADVTTHTAANAYNQILLYGGASLYRDAVDERFMTDATNGTTSYQMTETTDGEGNAVTEFTKGIVDKINDPAAAAVAEQPSFPMLAVVERPANWDTDLDGIPDAWEDANGLNKNSAADGNLYTLDSEKTWYTNLEVYLNSIVEDITKAQTSGAEIEIEDEYYPEWIEPTAESLTEFVLSDKTHSSGSANVWTFSNGFGVTGQEGRTYASTGDYIKYSNGYEYTISVPSNVTVYKVKVEGYANAAVGTTSYLEAFGTQTFDATRYVFPSGNASVNRASYEFTLPEAVTGGTLKIKATGEQTCLIVTLYGTKEGVTLEDKENEITIPGGESSETGTIKWAMTTGEKEDAIYTNITSEGFNGTGDITLQNVDYNGTVTIQSKEYTETQFRPTKTDENNIIDFIVTLNDGYTFTPTKVEFIATRVGTNAGTLTASFNNNNIFNELGSFTPNRNKDYNSNNETIDASPYYTKGEYNITNVEDITGTFGVRFQLDGVATNKDYALCNIIIHGTLKHNVVTTVTLDEMATVHNLDAADNVTVEMKRGLTAGAWNTFCVPFNLTKTELQTALSDNNVEIVEYTSQEGTTLYFEDIEDTDIIEAGKPYLIRPASFSRTYDECEKTPITFEGVNLVAANMKSNSRDVAGEVCPGVADYSFVGTYVRYIMETDGTELGLNSKNKLAKPAASTNIMRGLRGFFRYNAGNGAGAKVVINGTLTSIDEIDGGTAGAKGVYHVSGRYVRSEWNNGSGLPRGLYIVNGQKMVK